MASERSPFELVRDALELAERASQLRPLAKASESDDARVQRWLSVAHQRVVQWADQLEKTGMTHSEIAFECGYDKTSFSNIYSHGFTRRNQVQGRLMIALEELVLARSIRRVSNG